MTKALWVLISGGALFLIAYNFVFLPDGRRIFEREGCGGCHSFKGTGGGAGPDLTAVRQRRSRSWLVTHIENPQAHGPEARMPAFKHLNRRDIRAIVRYLGE